MNAPVANAAPQGRPMAPGSVQVSPPQSPSVAPSAPAAAPSAQPGTATPTIPAGQPLTAPVAAPAQTASTESTPPATEPKRRGRKPQSEENRSYYPGLNVDAEHNATTKLNAAPTDFDPEKYFPLRKRDFSDEATFLDYKAARYEAEAAQCRKEAEELRKLGGAEAQAQSKKLQKMIDSIATISGSLGGGADALIAQLRAKMEEKAKEAETAKTAEPAAQAS